MHKWGRSNRVAFDAEKEHLILIHPIHAAGDPFKLLGCMTDCKLTMSVEIERVLAKIRPKITAILRTRFHYSTKDLIAQVKTHVWGLMEANNGGIFHAATSLLDKIDGTQRRFLREIGMTESQAFLDHNFASPTLRRNIGILGMLHKRTLGMCHPMMEKLLPTWQQRFGRQRPDKHDKQIYGNFLEVHWQRDLFDRSIFAMCSVYNDLPQYVVDAPTVSVFQKHLTHIARTRCKNNLPNWVYTFDKRSRQ